jgi:L-fucose isomerase-like protein
MKSVVSGIRNFDYLTKKYGIRFAFINAEEVLNAVTDLDKKGIKVAEEIADDLIENAEFCCMDRKHIVTSAKYYVVVKRLLDKYECNAFTTPCSEICVTRRLNKDKYTFCLAHTLLKEEGIPSACEADISVLFAMDILMNITNSAPHMGNLHPASITNFVPNLGGGGSLVSSDFRNTPEKFKKIDNLIYIFHAVPTRYMGGRDKAPASYGIQSFTYSGWGATIRHNYDEDISKEITFMRVDPTGTKMLATKAQIVGDVGYKDNIGCSTGFYAQVDDVKDFFKKESQVGHHHAWVYGDIREELKELGELIGMEIITA